MVGGGVELPVTLIVTHKEGKDTKVRNGPAHHASPVGRYDNKHKACANPSVKGSC